MTQLLDAVVVRARPDDACLRAVAAEAARELDTSARAVLLGLLLHLPRVAAAAGEVSLEESREEAGRLAAALPRSAAWRLPSGIELDALTFVDLGDRVSRDICERFHYLGSHRDGGRTHALVTPTGDVVALGVTTTCDVDALRTLATAAFDDDQPRVLARVFAFEGAPPNTLTRLFKLVARSERAKGAASMVTYVNPNMGFSGASYRAGNWTRIGEEPGTTYGYLDNHYVTDRKLADLIGHTTPDEHLLAAIYGPRYRRSSMPLLPLQVYGRRI